LALRPTGNDQGNFHFFSLSTGRLLNRVHATSLPMPDDVIDPVNTIGRRQKANSGLFFTNRSHDGADAEDDDADDDRYLPLTDDSDDSHNIDVVDNEEDDADDVDDVEDYADDTNRDSNEHDDYVDDNDDTSGSSGDAADNAFYDLNPNDGEDDNNDRNTARPPPPPVLPILPETPGVVEVKRNMSPQNIWKTQEWSMNSKRPTPRNTQKFCAKQMSPSATTKHKRPSSHTWISNIDLAQVATTSDPEKNCHTPTAHRIQAVMVTSTLPSTVRP
jgi:hypothetical protein